MLLILSTGGIRRSPTSLHYIFWALDTLAIPVMSAECERIFSSTKKLITPERNSLHEQIIEASECSKNWWDQGLIQQQPSGSEDDSDDCQLEDEGSNNL
jgi:hypothetical protein